MREAARWAAAYYTLYSTTSTKNLLIPRKLAFDVFGIIDIDWIVAFVGV
jgi:hypothetical protein